MVEFGFDDETTSSNSATSPISLFPPMSSAFSLPQIFGFSLLILCSPLICVVVRDIILMIAWILVRKSRLGLESVSR